MAVRPNSTVSADLLKARFPGADVTEYGDTTSCFAALADGRARSVVIPVTALDAVHEQNDLSGYKTSELPGTVSLAVWMRQDDPMLLTIVNKGIANAKENLIAGTYTNDSYGEKESSLVKFVRFHQTGLITGAAVVLLARCPSSPGRCAARKAQAEAQAANAAKSAFLARMSHDIRTPLNGIIGLLGINDAHKDDAELVAQNRAKAHVAADRLLSLINDVLDMSKIEDRKVVLEHRSFDLPKLLGEVLVVGRLRASELGVEVVEEGREHIRCPHVLGSPEHVRRVMLNLVDNAVKYNRPGGEVRCSAQTLAVEGEKVRYRFTVSDTGIGMSVEFLKHIFEPFTQANDDARSSYQGTGMGMPIVKGLVEQMGGTIEVHSKLGEGSVFVVELPFDVDRGPEAHGATETGGAAAGAAVAVGSDAHAIDGMRVLLVEDNDLNREIAQTLLEDEGVAVTCAADGQEAVDVFKSRPAGSFDAIMMDIMMPVMDGYEATRGIRLSAKADAGSVPIFAMTANAFAEDAQRAREAGMNGHLAKPIDMAAVKRALSCVRPHA